MEWRKVAENKQKIARQHTDTDHILQLQGRHGRYRLSYIFSSRTPEGTKC